MNLPPRALLRREHPLRDAFGPGSPSRSDEALTEAMSRHSARIDCPIVEAPPPETVPGVLPEVWAGVFRR